MSTPPPVDEQLLADAIEIAEGAAALTLDWFGAGDLSVELKADGSEVTTADRAAESFVHDAVRGRYPDDTIRGEESGETQGSTSRTWIIDPIDGTTSFVRGVPLYTTLLAVMDEYGPALGVVIAPALDERVTAGRGRGCFHNGAPASVSSVDAVRDSCLSSSAYDGSWWPRKALLAVTDSGAKTRTWGDGYGYMLVATGRVEAMIEPKLNTWDIAPMLTVIPEAGGIITTWAGATQLEQDAGWIASNGRVHNKLLDLIS